MTRTNTNTSATNTLKETPFRDAIQGKFTAFIERRRRWLLLGIVLVAALLRIVYFAQAVDGPLAIMDRWDQTDMNYYDFWAGRIIDGDWLSRDVSPPMHDWQREISQAYFRKNPGTLLELVDEGRARGGDGFDADKELWVRWLGARRYYQEPLYAYLVAATYALAGRNPIAVLGWQLAMGLLNILLVYAIARRYFDTTAGLVAALLTTLSSALLMYEFTLLRDSVVVFLGLLMLWLTGIAVERARLAGATQQSIRGGGRSWYWWIPVGLAVGLGMMAKGIFTVYLVGLLPLLAALYWRRWKRLLVAAAVLLAGVILVQAPLILRNIRVGVPPMAIAGNATFAFIQNNAADYRWEMTALVSPEYLPELLGKSGGKVAPAVVETLRTHRNFGSVASMIWSKFHAAWHWWERPDNANIYNYELYAPVLGWLLPFTALAPLALVGLVIGSRRFWPCWPLYLLVATGLLPMVILNVMARFRLIMIAACMPFAALALVQLIRWLAQRQPLKAAPILFALVLLPFWTASTLPNNMTVLRPADVNMSFHLYYEPKVQAALQSGGPGEAATVLRDFLQREPTAVREIGPMHPARDIMEAAVAMLYAQAHQHLATLLEMTGDLVGAQEQMNRVIQIQSGSASFLRAAPAARW